MEVYVSFRQKANIDPIDVLKELKSISLSGDRDWVFEKDGEYYHGYEGGGGSHSWDEKDSISKEQYDYIRALELCIKYLSNDKRK